MVAFMVAFIIGQSMLFVGQAPDQPQAVQRSMELGLAWAEHAAPVADAWAGALPARKAGALAGLVFGTARCDTLASLLWCSAATSAYAQAAALARSDGGVELGAHWYNIDTSTSMSLAVTTQQTTQLERTRDNVWDFLCHYAGLVQQRGKYTLAEASSLKRALDVQQQHGDSAGEDEARLIHARQTVLRSIELGQKRGAFSMQDADVLNQLVAFLQAITAPVVGPDLTTIDEGDEAEEAKPSP